MPFRWWLLVLIVGFQTSGARAEGPLEIVGVHVVPHVQAPGMRYRRDPDPSLGARVQLFLRNTGRDEVTLSPDLSVKFRGRTPQELVGDGDWAWFDAPSAWPESPLRLPPGAVTVWQFNSRDAEWGVGTSVDLAAESATDGTLIRQEFEIARPSAWLSTVTFLGEDKSIAPDRVVVHVANDTDEMLRPLACRLWIPHEHATWRALLPSAAEPITDAFPKGGIPPKDRGSAVIKLGNLPLTYTAIELQCADSDGNAFSLWSHLRIKRECFDISGGWVASTVGNQNTLQFEPFLKTLKRMHVNTAHIAETPGYTDQDGPRGLYTSYPLKYFNKLQPVDQYDTDTMLPRIHAVEFLGEPQYGGGRPVPPMEVWKQLAPYQATRLPTTITHSEERIWRYYAGLSDYPHYDAYRVTAPSPDAWWKYDRWGGQTIRWGAPLETIGEMCRSLRELNRPMPTAYWSQGPHAGWGKYGGRQRTSPTRDELRMQAYHALASRITSLYWFNLSLPSLVKFPDLIDEITRVGREIRMLDQLYLEGDAYDFRRVDRGGKPDWELAVVSSPRAALLFALDLDYEPDPQDKIFRFKQPRAAELRFPLPPHLKGPAEVFKIDADGSTAVTHRVSDGQVVVTDRIAKVAIYVVAASPALRAQLEARRQSLLEQEAATRFDPAGKPEDLARLRALLEVSD